MKENLKKAIFLLQQYAPPCEFTSSAINSIKELEVERKTAFLEGYKKGQADKIEQNTQAEGELESEKRV